MCDQDIPALAVPDSKRERFDKIKTLFKEKFGEDPQFIARSPGRVNLIGEHIDYCGYAVLPMAIEQDIVMAVSPDTKGQITLINTDEQYKEFTCDVMQINITKDKPTWYKYVLCGVLGMKEKFCSLITMGFKAVVDGTIPPSAGLSSSSALVCCSALAMLKANQWPISKNELADACSKCERYIGTEGGGMDQAISLTAQQGKAKLIEFNPLKTTDVQLPPGASFIVSNSLAEMNKAATPQYNTRVVECRIASQILALSQPDINWKDVKRLGDLQKKLGLSLDDMIQMVEKNLHQEPYSKEEICGILNVEPKELEQTSLSANTLEVQIFKLYQRAIHVYGEAKRVLQFKEICDKQPADAIQQLGELMNASHTSCRYFYECSHPDLDRLVEICKQRGAVGSRMTGAGWGGCVVSLVHSDSCQSLLEGVKDSYYMSDDKRASKVQTSLFASDPGNGGAYYN